MEITETTTIHYEWKERVDGELRVPCSDPMVHETPFDFQFDSVESAIDAIEEWSMPYDPETWVLVTVTTQVVNLDANEQMLLARVALCPACGRLPADPDCVVEWVGAVDSERTAWCSNCWQAL